jgi:peptide subunit release factor 1 (eRF1)
MHSEQIQDLLAQAQPVHGSSAITLSIPSNQSITSMVQFLRDELATSHQIKSRV